MRVGEPAPLCPSLEDACRRWPSRPAVTFEGATWTYGELWQRVDALAAAYQRLGVGHGDRVLCQLRNCPEHVAAMAAAWRVGAAHVGADNDLTGGELARLAQRLDVAAMVFQPPAAATEPLAALAAVEQARPDLPIAVHGADAGADGAATNARRHQLAELLAEPGGAQPAAVEGLDPAMVFLTSGTTGEPKAVVEPLAAHWAKMQFFSDAFAPGGDDVHLLHLPVSHVFGSRLAGLALLRGGRLVLADRFSPSRALQVATAEQATVLPAVPAQLQLLADHHDPARHDLSRLRWVISAAAPLPRHLPEWVAHTLGARMMFVFGCSEGFTTVTTDLDDILAGSVGNTIYQGPPGTAPTGAVRAVDPDDGTPRAPGEVGEIAFGAEVPVPYWDHPRPAADGWYHTGDLGYVDADGRVFLVGRRKELINRGGLHVSPAEVEPVLADHPAVADAAVIGVPDRVVGEAVCACVVPAAGADAPDLGELHRHAGRWLARHKLPDELCVLDVVDRTDLGKVDRAAVRARVVDGGLPRQRAARPAAGSQPSG